MSASTGKVWHAFSERLGRFVRKRVRDPHDADDVLQEIARKVHTGLERVENVGHLEAWLFQVARRAMIDHFRARSPKRHPGELPADLGAKTPEPGTVAELAACIRPLMDSLSSEDREALLAELEGVTQKEIAARLGISLSGAKSRVQRARKRLKALLLACCHIELDRRGNAMDCTPRGGGCGSCSDR